MSMERLKILPAAAVIIALTAAVYFVRDQRENEEADSVRAKIVERSPHGKASDSSWPAVIDSETGQVYLIEVGRDDAKRQVLVDANTGKVLDHGFVILDDRHTRNSAA
jgi:Peptidase propeptide and YPEB domain